MYLLHLNGTIPRTSTPILLYNTMYYIIILTIGFGVQSVFFVTDTCYILLPSQTRLVEMPNEAQLKCKRHTSKSQSSH